MSNVLIHPIILEDLASIAKADLPWSGFTGKTILVTGASGFLPAYMVETLLFLNTNMAVGCKVIGLVRNLEKARKRFLAYQHRTDLVLIQGDISTDINWPERCDFIIHAASQASPKFYGADPVGTMTANFLGTYNLLNHARAWKSEGFLYFSSGEVYGNAASGTPPATAEEDYGYIDIANTRSCYAESKRAAETLGFCYSKQFGVPFKVVRPFHTYGPGMALDDGRVFADLVNDVVVGRKLTLRSDGSAVRAFCYISDAVAGYFTVLLRGDVATPYNVGNPSGAMSISALADMLSCLPSGSPLGVERSGRSSQTYMASPVLISIPDVERLKALGWSQQYSPRDGFARTIRFFTHGIS